MAGLMTRMGEEEEDKGEMGGRGKRENTGRTYWQWDQRPDASNSGPHIKTEICRRFVKPTHGCVNNLSHCNLGHMCMCLIPSRSEP